MKRSHSQSRRLNHKVVINVPPCPQEEMLMGGKKSFKPKSSWLLLEYWYYLQVRSWYNFIIIREFIPKKGVPCSVAGGSLVCQFTRTWQAQLEEATETQVAVWQLWRHVLGPLTLSLGKPQWSHLLWLLAVVKWLLSVFHVTSWKLKAWLTEAAFPGLCISLPLWSCKEAKGWWEFFSWTPTLRKKEALLAVSTMNNVSGHLLK